MTLKLNVHSKNENTLKIFYEIYLDIHNVFVKTMKEKLFCDFRTVFADSNY